MADTLVTEVAENLFRIRLPMPFGLDHINVYLLKEPDGVVLVDCGLDMPESHQKLDEGLAQLGLSPDRLTDIFVTHAHPDHIGQLERLRRLAPGAHLYLHRREYQPLQERLTDQTGVTHRMSNWLERNGVTQLSGGMAGSGVNYLPEIHPGDRLLAGGESFRFDKPSLANPTTQDRIQGAWEVFWTPGHTAGHYVLYNRDRRLLLSGDHLLGSISSNIGKYPGSTDDPLGDFIASLEQIRHLDIGEVLPAHGPTFSNYLERIDDLEDHHQVRLGRIYAALEGGPRTAAQVVETIWGDRARGFHRILALGEALSHLERLRLEGRVVAEETSDRVWFRAA
ncbi:MAG: MBL fold metallo-hydrolase [Chloroflexi bacterium]|nr:MBL fold metallo-hydrolase [Chloroflexota bacterium]